jgi:hypothetical protein
MLLRSIRRFVCLLWVALSVSTLSGQAPTATLSGVVADPAGKPVVEAVVSLRNPTLGLSRTQPTDASGGFRFHAIPPGSYTLRVESAPFALLETTVPQLSLGESRELRLGLSLESRSETVAVEAEFGRVGTQAAGVGNLVTGRELVDLPLNGRNFTQLGLLQPGVAPLPQGLQQGGGSIRNGQAYAINGARPEANLYLLDGVRNVNRMDAGYALAMPVDAIAEFHVLTHGAPAEYGGTAGAATSVVTRSGGNDWHGNLYAFLRNDVFDARNFFASEVQPLKQNQFGSTLGGPLRRNKLFVFGYYEGYINRQGIVRTVTVPTAAQRSGDYSAVRNADGTPFVLRNLMTGMPLPANRIPAAMQSALAANIVRFYPLANRGDNLFSTTQVQRNNRHQGGLRLDSTRQSGGQTFARYSQSAGDNWNPLSVRGADVPGFPVGDDITVKSAVVGDTAVLGPRTIQTVRGAWFGYDFLFDRRFNRTSPRELGFGYDTTFDPAQGPPYFIPQGYATVGNPITGPRDTSQSTWEGYYGLSLVRGNHSLQFGGELRDTRLDISQGIAANGFFVFATVPFNDAFANLLIGRPVVFFQGGGDFRRQLNSQDAALYLQDEWRAHRRLTVTAGLRWEWNSPFGEAKNRLNAYVPGAQSTVFPNAPAGVLFPGDPGIPDRIVQQYRKGFMPRLGLAWDLTGTGQTTFRTSYGIYFDQFANGTGQPMQAAISALPYTQARQISGPTFPFQNPFGNETDPFAPGKFPAPATVLSIDHASRPPYVQQWNASLEHRLPGDWTVEGRYIGTKGTRLPRYREANPAIFGPGATAQNADARRLYANCPPNGGPCQVAHAGLLTYGTNSIYHGGQLFARRRFGSRFGFQASYWFSKAIDNISSLAIAGSAPRLLSGENDLAQNPFDLNAERGLSLFDATHRVTIAGSLQLPALREGHRALRALLKDWQWNGILTGASGTPFTVFDGNNVSLQGTAPPITGFYSSRPDAIANPNTGVRTVEQWVRRAAFRRLDPVTELGKFGNAGRNTVRAPGLLNADLSLVRSVRFREAQEVQLRVECFNILNRANFLVPVSDMVSPNFGRILDAGSPRLWQAGVKWAF